MSRFNKKSAFLGVALVMVALVAVWLADARNIRVAGTIRLSDDKAVYLGQSRNELVKSLGTSLRSVNDYYGYSPSGDEVEAVIYLHQDSVSSIQVMSNSRNQHLLTDARIGLSIRQLKASGGILQDINPQRNTSQLSGYRLSEKRLIAYYLTDPCVGNDRIVGFALAQKEQEPTALNSFKAGRCDV